MLVRNIEISFNTSQLYTEDVQVLINDMNNELPGLVQELQSRVYLRSEYCASQCSKVHGYDGKAPMKIGFRSGRGEKGHFANMADSTSNLLVVRVPDILAQFTGEEQIAMIGSGNLRLNADLRRGLVAELSALFLPSGLRPSIYQWKTQNSEDQLAKHSSENGPAASELFLATMRSLAAHPIRFEQQIKKPNAEAKRISKLSQALDYINSVQQAHPSCAYYKLNDAKTCLTHLREKTNALGMEDKITQHIVMVEHMMAKLPAITTTLEELRAIIDNEINKEQSK